MTSIMMKKILILLGFLFLITGCTPGDSYVEESGSRKMEIGNPYDEGSGHYAGYEWAAETGGGCSGNSESFNEGCEEYYRQINSK